MIRAARWSLVLLSSAGLAACTGEGVSPARPTGPAPLAPVDQSSGVHASEGSSGCYTVKFVVEPTPLGPFSFEASVSGDLEGSSTIEFDPGSVTFAGVTIHNSGVSYWDITGGVVPGLGTFVTEFDNMNIAIDRPGSPGTLFENIGKHRAVDGVAKANLRIKGTFDLEPSPHGEHHYQGVICP